MLLAISAIAALALVFGTTLVFIAARMPQQEDSPVERINRLLPQSQCGQCGFPGCRPYAEAVANGTAPINRCAPGGDHTVIALARLLGRSADAVDRAYGQPEPAMVARIDESRCIGCALCLPACPVDAIIGAPQFTHTVLAAECTGCRLCLPPCPVDCITVIRRDQRTG